MDKALMAQTCAANRLLLEHNRKRYTSDNVSLCDRRTRTVIIKPRDNNLNDLESEDMLVYDLITGNKIYGFGDPYEDYRIHLEIYRNNPQIQSILSSSTPNKLLISTVNENTYYGIDIISKENVNIKDADITGMVFLKQGGALVWSYTPINSIELDELLEEEIKLLQKFKKNTINDDYRWKSFDINEKEFELVSTSNFGYCGPKGKRITDLERKQVNLNLLIYFDKICRTNNVHYSLTGGTLLGAVRHGGFIPWDDDVDVFLTRPEYEKLLSIFPDDDRYVLVNRRKEQGFPYVFSRLFDNKTFVKTANYTACEGKGLFVDIWVVDGLPKSKTKRNLHIKRMHVYEVFRSYTLRDIDKVKKEKGRFVGMVASFIKNFTTIEHWNRKMEVYMKKYKFDSSEYIGNFISVYGAKEKMHRSVFDGYGDMYFEGYPFMVCTGYEEYLKNVYGDYLQLPQINKRIGHHDYLEYWE